MNQTKRKTRPKSPTKQTRPSSFPSKPEPSSRSGVTRPSSLLHQDHIAEVDNTTSLFEHLQVSEQYAVSRAIEPRSFPYSVKQQCWEKAEKVKGRDPDRWRRDALGNIVFRKLVGCPGCLCHDYDHILPYSKGGKSTLENCQVLQATVNRSKGNRTEFSKAELIERSSYCRVSGRDMDLIELSAYGNVRRAQDSGGCRIQ